MRVYQDITLLPDSDVSLGFIWEKVYRQIHLMLVEHKTGINTSAIGLSFPRYGEHAFPLGNQLRLFASTENQLVKAQVSQWLQNLTDYVHVKSVQAVPENIQEHACFTRKNPKSQQRKLKQLDGRVKHLSTKHKVAADELRGKLVTSIFEHTEKCKLPYINVQSLSTSDAHQKHKFLMFIQCDKSNSNSNSSAEFNCYGLSSKEEGQRTFVPWF